MVRREGPKCLLLPTATWAHWLPSWATSLPPVEGVEQSRPTGVVPGAGRDKRALWGSIWGSAGEGAEATSSRCGTGAVQGDALAGWRRWQGCGQPAAV